MIKPILFPWMIIFLLSISVSSQAQMIREVHTNRNDYLLDVTAILEYSKNKDYLAKGEELLEEFTGLWESGYFQDHHREKIYSISNRMLNKSMRSYPHFYDFFHILTDFYRLGLNDNDLELWLMQYDTLGVDRSSRPMTQFLDYTRNLFDNSMLFETRSRAWYFRNGGFHFDQDTALFLYFEKTNLVCSTGRDSMEIKETRGKYYIEGELWEGKMGTISWLRAGYSEDSVYAELKKYRADLKTLSFSADSVVFYNRYFFDFPMLGSLEEKVLSSAPGDRTSYPRFSSYRNDFEISGLYENVSCYGGIGMQGSKLVCVGKANMPAKMVFEKGGEYFAVIRSNLFEVKRSEITSSPASFSIFFDKDSIYHPGLQMKYENDTKLLSLVRLNRGIAQSPFFNAYHKVNMYAEALYWVMNSDQLSFESVMALSNESKADFESDKFYSAFEYYKLQGIDETNPLILVRNYTKTYGSRKVMVGAFADFIGKPVEQAVSMLLLLDSRGFVIYNSDTRSAQVKDQLYDYIEAHAGNIDYDVIRFNSVTTDRSNAVVELATFDMQINGVPEIFLSDSQRVYIYPVNEEIIMRQNKGFHFSGRVRAGLFEFYGQDCSFEYDTFRINLPTIDSMSFFVRIPDTSGKEERPRYFRVQAMVENMSGSLYIDDAGNKSGLKEYPQYPLFNSHGNSFVYYDRLEGLDSAYDRDQFYYELDPFVIDSLNEFSTAGLRFDGYLSTGGILPPLEDELVVMDDYSLGVKSITDDEGIPLYDGKARFYDTITMDNAGLHGSGRFEYLTSQTIASDIDFFPDSMVSRTQSFHIDKFLSDVEYPDVSVGVARQRWYPDSGLMRISVVDEAISMYDSTSSLDGSLALSADGLNGEGEFRYERALIESEDFSFGHHSMAADTSDFRLYTDTSYTELAFLTNDFRTDLDFDQRQGKFISTGLSSLVDMPFNQFICYMDEISWDMDAGRMNLSNNIVDEIPGLDTMNMNQRIGLNLMGADFISTLPEHDSLRFFSSQASYDLKSNIIFAEDVKIIRVADAAIFPGDGKLNILEGAQIETLQRASVIADTATQFHHIFDANVNIYSRHNYVANGYVDYEDISGVVSPIYLSTINVDSLGRTYAFGNLTETEAFKLAPWYAYSGDVHLQAWQQFLRFDGYFSIEQDCYEAYNNRALIDTLVDPMNILIPVQDSLRGPEGEHIPVSLMYSPGTSAFYSAFFSARKRDTDIAVLSAHGQLSHDPERETFRVSEVSDDSLQSYLSFHSDNCVVEGRGTLDPALDLPHVGLELYGNAAHYIIPDSTRFDLVMGYDFFFDPSVLRRFTRALNDANLPGTATGNPEFLTFLKERIPASEAEKILDDLSTFGTIRKLPDNIAYTMLLNGIKFNWNPEESSFVSYGDLSIFSVGTEVVNRVVPGYVEIERKPNGFGVVNLYIEIPDGDWYFFSYRNYILQAISSNEGFNNELLGLGEDKRISFTDDDEIPYEFVISSRRKMVDFKRRMEEINGVKR